MRLILVFILLGAGVAFGQTSDGDSAAVATVDSTGMPYALSIEHKRAAWPLDEDTINVLVESGETEFAGFDLSIAVAASGYEVVTVLPGEFHEECGWEFFNARDLLIEASDGRMLKAWKIIGLADVMPDSVEPSCRNAPEPVSIARLVVRSRDGASAEPGKIPIFFVWKDCGDNSLSDASGNKLFLSRQVSNYIRPGADLSNDVFPNFTGAPRQCAGSERIVRAIEFRSGGIEVEVVDTLAPTPIEDAG